MKKKKLCNEELRTYLKDKQVPMWRLADYLKISEPSISRLFRYEIEGKEREKILAAVDAIAAEG